VVTVVGRADPLPAGETIEVPGREVTKPVPQAERSLGSILSIRLWS